MLVTPQAMSLKEVMMSREIKAFQFWVHPINGPTAPVRDAVAAVGNGNRSFEFTLSSRTFLAQNLMWESRRGILTGTIYLVRSHDLPAAIFDGKAGPLPIDDQTDLGEPMCFAFHPELGVAMIHYAHTGPRHSALAGIVERLCPDLPILIEPVIRQDMLERLRETSYFRALEFALTDPKGVQELRAMGGSVGNAISMLDDTGGVSVRVEITMGHTSGRGLIADKIRDVARKLAMIGVKDVEGPGSVRSIKVRGAKGADAVVEELDLLKAREKILLEVAESSRSIDTTDACRKLTISLNDRLDSLRTQRHAD